MHGCDSTGVIEQISVFKCSSHTNPLSSLLSVFSHTQRPSLFMFVNFFHTHRGLFSSPLSMFAHTQTSTHTHTPTPFISISIFREVYSPQVCRFHTQSSLLSSQFLSTFSHIQTHSEHCFPAPSSKLCQTWLCHWRGTLYLCAAVQWRGQCPPKGSDTDKTVEAT